MLPPPSAPVTSASGSIPGSQPTTTFTIDISCSADNHERKSLPGTTGRQTYNLEQAGLMKIIAIKKQWTIKQKMLSGFGVMLVILTVIGVQTTTSVMSIRAATENMVEHRQPALLLSKSLETRVTEAFGSMGYYLLSKDERMREMSIRDIEQASELLEQIRTLPIMKVFTAAQILLDNIGQEIKQFRQFQEQLFELTNDRRLNFPAMQYSVQQLNPLSEEIIQSLTNMLEAEPEGDAATNAEILELIHGMRYAWIRNMAEIRSYLGFKNASSLKQRVLFYQVFRDQLDTLQNKYGDKLSLEHESGLDNINVIVAQFEKNMSTMVAMHSGEKWRTDAYLVRTRIIPLLDKLSTTTASLIDTETGKITEDSMALLDMSDTTAYVVLIMVAIALVTVLVLAYIFISRLLVPMTTAVESGIRSLAELLPDQSAIGDLDQGNALDQVETLFDIMTETLNDTIEQQKQANEKLRDQVDQILGVVSTAADGDMSQSITGFDGNDTIDHLANGLNKMIANLNELVCQVQKSGIQVNSSATQIAATAKQQEATVSEQAASTNQVMATVNEISATSKELARTMEYVQQTSSTAAESASSGQQALNLMEETMLRMRTATENITSKLSVLNDKANNISNVVTTINKVADQTNLLSLNAAIEAEKAGEFGRGFSVVATEIRRLADQTAVSTWDIEQMVKEMQSAVSAGVMGMDKFSEEVGSGVTEIGQIGSQLSQVIQQVHAMKPKFETVTEGMQAQALGNEQISQSMSQLNETAHQTAESLRQSNQSISHLKDAAKGLQQGVSRFKLKDTG